MTDVTYEDVMPRKRAADVPRETPSQMRQRVVTAIETSARDDGFALDPCQHAAVEALASAAARTVAGEAPGVYLWGPVGRGKTWLLDAFVRCWPPHAARRFHFHRFFREFHEARHRRGFGAASVSGTVEDLVGGATVVCFDELFAHEPGDAYLFTSILTELREHRPVPMVVTSNYAPDDLLPDAEFVTSGSTWEESVVKIDHCAFETGIALIKRSFEIV
jgi:cell division protein ZapE